MFFYGKPYNCVTKSNTVLHFAKPPKHTSFSEGFGDFHLDTPRTFSDSSCFSCSRVRTSLLSENMNLQTEKPIKDLDGQFYFRLSKFNYIYMIKLFLKFKNIAIKLLSNFQNLMKQMTGYFL